MTEQDMVKKAAAGDQDAFEQLVLDHQDRVFSLAFHLVGDREQAADLAQEAFLKAWKGLGSFQGESSFGTWMHRLTTNVCLDYLRRQARRREVAAVVSLDDEDSGWAEPADERQDPHRQLEAAERRQALQEGLARLPEHHRQVLLLREVAGLSYQEIAKATDADLGTVKSRIARGRNQLRKILLSHGNLFPFDASKSMKKKEGGEREDEL